MAQIASAVMDRIAETPCVLPGRHGLWRGAPPAGLRRPRIWYRVWYRVWAACHVLWLLALADPALAADELQQRTAFYVDPPTLQSLGFRCYIRGDDDGDATGEIHYRRAGEQQWRAALPMLRVNREVSNYDFHPYAAENLRADTEYEVRCRIADPDGGAVDTLVTVRTRPVPQAPAPLRVLHVYPPGHSGKRQKPAFERLAEACATVRPGDHVLLHAGSHPAGPDSIRMPTSGTAAAPIVVRAAGDGPAIVDASGAAMLFDLRDRDYLFFEDLDLRGADYTFRADGASWLTVRRCQISDTEMGLYSYSERSTNWYIADNTIIGRNTTWYPRTQDNPSHTGINFYGRGHVICHNRISRFWDAIAIANYGKPPHDLALQPVAIDIYHNDLSEAVDDAIEADYGCHNIRIFGNRIRNVHTGLSAQPTYGGPIYFLRNTVYNATSLSLKLHNWCSGLVIYHNTLISARGAFRSYPRWQNAMLRNNLFLGASGYAVETGSHDQRVSLDYNGYRRADEQRLFKWFDGAQYTRYEDLAQFTQATGHEAHGRMVDFDVFVRAMAPVEGHTYDESEYDLTLATGQVGIDAALRLVNINDGFTGEAPDLGAFERDVPPPHFGPRPPSAAGSNM